MYDPHHVWLYTHTYLELNFPVGNTSTCLHHTMLSLVTDAQAILSVGLNLIC